MRFRKFLAEQIGAEERKDIIKTLQKIPQAHAALVQGYEWKFHAGNTLNGDDEHVGYMDDGAKEIAVAAPWNYSREFTMLHEIAHRVWEQLVPKPLKIEWHKLVESTPEKDDQSPEELFCHAYAATYCNRPPSDHFKPQWAHFIKNLPA